MADIKYLCRRCGHTGPDHEALDSGALGINYFCRYCSCHMPDIEDNLDYLLRVGREKRSRIAMARLSETTWIPKEVCECPHGVEWHSRGRCWFLECAC